MREGYSKELNDLYDRANSMLRINAPLTDIETICNKMIKIGKDMKDDYIIGSGYFFLEKAYFENNADEKMLQTHVYTIPYLTSAGDFRNLSKCYNDMGVISVTRNNYSNAIENYLLALDICKTHKFKYNEGITYCNIGEMYRCNSNYKDAINYYKKALKLCHESPKNTPYYFSNLLLIDSALLYCYTKRRDYSKAAVTLSEIETLENKAEDDYHLLPEYCARFRYFYDTGIPADLNGYVEKILEELKKLNSLHDFFTYIIDLCDTLFEVKKYDFLIRAAHILEENMNKYEGDSPFLKSYIAAYKIRYYKVIGNERHYKKALKAFYETTAARNDYIKNFNKSIIDAQIKNIELTKKFRKTVESIEKLKVHADHDALTGLYNYGYIKDMLENMFVDAAVKKETLGVAIIDIDFFKQYNDTYGHQQGDEAIKAVANVLTEVSNENITPSRYGGDEFIVVFKNMRDDQMIDCCNRIRRNISNLNIEHKGSLTSDRLSVSVGARNSVPHKANKTWDYLYAADMALYDVKEFQKGGMQLVHRYLTPKSKTGNKENRNTIM